MPFCVEVLFAFVTFETLFKTTLFNIEGDMINMFARTLKRNIFVLVIFFLLFGCQEETVTLPSPEIKISSVKINSLTTYEVDVDIDPGDGQQLQKIDLVLEDITIASNSPIVKEITSVSDSAKRYAITFNTDRLNHDYTAQATLYTDKYTYPTEKQIIRSFKNNFRVYLPDDNNYSGLDPEVGAYQNKGSKVTLHIDFQHTYSPRSFEVKLNQSVELASAFDFGNYWQGNGILTAGGTAQLPLQLAPGRYSITVYIDGIEFPCEQKIQVLGGNWHRFNNNFSDRFRGEYAWFVLGNKLYVVGGRYYANALDKSPVWELDLDSREWTAKKDFPHEIDFQNPDETSRTFIHPGQFNYQDKGYVLERRDTIYTLWKYDEATDSWAKVTQYPGVAHQKMTSFITSDYLFLGGGMEPVDEGYVDNMIEYHDFWSYSFKENKWIKKGDTPMDVLFWTEPACGINGKAYVLAPYNKLWEYDSANDSWLLKGTLPGPVRHSTGLFSDGSHLYIAGGEIQRPDGMYYLKDFWKYSPDTDALEMLAFLPENISGFGVAFSWSGKMYAGLGYQIGYDSGWGESIFEYTPE